MFAPVHAAVIAINDAIDRQIPSETFVAMKNPNAMLLNLEESVAPVYQDTLYQAKRDKTENARNRVGAPVFPYGPCREVRAPVTRLCPMLLHWRSGHLGQLAAAPL